MILQLSKLLFLISYFNINLSLLRIRAYEVEIEKIVEKEMKFLSLFFNGRGDEVLELDSDYAAVILFSLIT